MTAEREQERSTLVEDLDVVASVVVDVDPTVGGHRDVEGADELPVLCALTAPGQEEGAVGTEFLDPVVAHVGDIDVAGGVEGHRSAPPAAGVVDEVKLALGTAGRAPGLE